MQKPLANALYEEPYFVYVKRKLHLNTKTFSGLVCLVQHYQQNDLKLRRFVPIIKDSIVYPVLYDANRTVLSLPPIINGSHSQVSYSSLLTYHVEYLWRKDPLK